MFSNKIVVEYYWRPLEPLERDYAVFVHFTDSKGRILFQQDHEPCYGLCPTSKWLPGELIHESYEIKIPAFGKCQLRPGFWDPLTGVKLRVVWDCNDGDNRAIVDSVGFPLWK